MAGIYIHIPFCKQACNYCNFHFSTSLQHNQQMVEAIITELIQRKHYLKQETIESIYFGGGTPSILNISQIELLLNTIYTHFIVSADAEITIEANPDDLNSQKINEYKSTAINRFSIGIQSFFDEELIWMNRAHKASEAIDCIKKIQDVGFTNLSIDLIYGSPTLTNTKWQTNLEQAISLGLNHISSYCLTVEPKTALAHQIKHKKLMPLDEDKAAQQFLIMVNTLEQAGFEQYEISNFAKPNHYAVHNTNYWKNKLYLGVGPSAHSFNQLTRSWNIANNMQYIKGINAHTPVAEIEILTTANRVNEYIMTSLRTIWGLDIKWIEDNFGLTIANDLTTKLNEKIAIGELVQNKNNFVLTKNARILADGIASDLFMDND